MAKREKKDIGLNSILAQAEQKIFLLKIQYEKYFSGIEKLEPTREFDILQKQFRDLSRRKITNTQQRYRLTQLKARFASMSLYWRRNMVMMQKGTHPKQKFRATVQEKRDQEMALNKQAHKQRIAKKKNSSGDSYQSVYDQLIIARQKTGQATNISFDSIKATLEKQSKAIRAQYNCDSVRFKVSIQNGKAKMKATPIRNEKK